HPNLNWDLKTIIFSPALGDQAHLLSVPHDHFVPQRGQNRLTQGECVPVSIAMRHRGMLLNTCFMASGVVATLCPKTISPASFKTQYALERSPRSTPMVSCPSKMFFPLVCIVLIFCIAGLLFCALSTSNIGSVSHPAGDRPSTSHLISRKPAHSGPRTSAVTSFTRIYAGPGASNPFRQSCCGYSACRDYHDGPRQENDQISRVNALRELRSYG